MISAGLVVARRVIILQSGFGLSLLTKLCRWLGYYFDTTIINIHETITDHIAPYEGEGHMSSRPWPII